MPSEKNSSNFEDLEVYISVLGFLLSWMKRKSDWILFGVYDIFLQIRKIFWLKKDFAGQELFNSTGKRRKNQTVDQKVDYLIKNSWNNGMMFDIDYEASMSAKICL